jgi:hypothetical protein
VNREQLEHVLRAASTIVGEAEVLVIGSQAVLASIPDDRLPPEATTSIEADLAFFDDPTDAKADIGRWRHRRAIAVPQPQSVRAKPA